MTWPFKPLGGEKSDEELRVGSRYTTVPQHIKDQWLRVYRVENSDLNDPMALWHNAVFRNANSNYAGLLNLIAARGDPDYTMFSVGIYDGAYFIRPFSQFLFVSDDGYVRPSLMRDLEKYFEASVGDLVFQSPAFGFIQRRNARGTRLFFGPGVFVPRKHAQQIGRLEIQMSNGGPWVRPSIHLDGERREAGFYAGQWGLSISTDAEWAPALFPGNALLDQNQGDFTLHFGSQEKNSEPKIVLVEHSENACPIREGVDWNKIASEQGQEIRSKLFRLRLRYTTDIRPERLTPSPKGESLLQFLGLVVPTWRNPKNDEKSTCYLDLDEDGFPVTTPFELKKYILRIAPKFSFGRTGKIKRQMYNWAEKTEDAVFDNSIVLHNVDLPGLWKGYLMEWKHSIGAQRWLSVDGLVDGKLNAAGLMDCGVSLEYRTKTIPWSQAFGSTESLIIRRANDILKVTSESGVSPLSSRVFQVDANGFALKPVDNSVHHFRSGDNVIIDGIFWRAHLK